MTRDQQRLQWRGPQKGSGRLKKTNKPEATTYIGFLLESATKRQKTPTSVLVSVELAEGEDTCCS
jgi:hypothetical protein